MGLKRKGKCKEFELLFGNVDEPELPLPLTRSGITMPTQEEGKEINKIIIYKPLYYRFTNCRGWRGLLEIIESKPPLKQLSFSRLHR